MKKFLSAGLVAVISASVLALTVIPARADFSDEEAMAICVMHKTHKQCVAMTHEQLMEMMKCMGSAGHNNACY